MRNRSGVGSWTRGPCRSCRRVRSLYRGKCVPCRQPENRRNLVDHGVPCMSADFLAQFAKRCVGKRMKVAQMQMALEAAHPILMENIRVSSDGILSVKDRSQIWIRRGGWEPGEILDPPHTI